MTRSILIVVLVGFMFAGFEGLADAIGSVVNDDRDHSHEMHNQLHADDHDHDEKGGGDSDGDDHFCHCGAHAALLSSTMVAIAADEIHEGLTLFDSRFKSRAGPPLLHPPSS